MAQAAIPQKTAAEEDSAHLRELEGPVMDAFWAVECAREMIEDEMHSLFGQIKSDNNEKVFFSRVQVERCIWMMNQASEKLDALKTAYYGN
ncbi:MAG: hypothetical protein PGN22_02585 [Agrobacterium cavarae]